MTVKHTILAVDDDNLLLTVLSDDLVHLGYNVLKARNGKEALQVARQSRPDIVLLDIMMPEMDGYEVCRVLKRDEATKDIPVVMLTVLSDHISRRKGFEAGAIDFLNKPIEMVELSLRLKNIIELTVRKSDQQDSYVQAEGAYGQNLRDLEDSYITAFYRLIQAASFSGQRGESYIDMISSLVVLLAGALGLQKKDVERMSKAGPLFDIGNIVMQGTPVTSEDDLYKDYLQRVKKHTEIAGKIFLNSKSELLLSASKFALYHHEHWDGTGHPSGLKGEAIPVEGRIMLLIDHYDSLRRGRFPYRKRYSHDEAARILVAGGDYSAPAHFDPEILDIFIQKNDKFGEIYDK